MNTYIGIDLGTSSVKLLLLAQDGTVRRTVSRRYPVSCPHPDWSEQNPEDWVSETLAGMVELLAGEHPECVRGIGVAGQMHGLVLLDAHGNVLRPAILWNDGRSAQETICLNRDLGEERLIKQTGNIAFSGFTLPKLLWVRNHEPEIYRQIATVLLPKDYLVYRLTGILGTDPSDACGTLLFDVRQNRWSTELLNACNIQKRFMPQVRGSGEIVGRILPTISSRLGIPPDAFAVAGAGDNAAAALGTGALTPGNCNLSLGTSGTLLIPCREYPQSPHRALHTFVHADGKPMLLGCILSAASCGQWWIEEILKSADYAQEQRLFGTGGAGALFFLPYLSGERSPHNDPHARGVFFGLSRDTTREQMTQAVYEGVTFALRDVLEAARAMRISPSSVTLCGGGAVSGAWCQMTANILNLNIMLPSQLQGPSLGGAMLAAVADGAFASLESAIRKMVTVQAVLKPDASAVGYYEERYRIYRKLYPAMKDLFPELIGPPHKTPR